MADWTDITNSQVEPKAPLTSELVTALRDNVPASMEGATGAPRLRGNAVERATDMPTLTVSAADPGFNVNNSTISTTGTTETSSNTFVEARRLEIASITGTVRLLSQHTLTLTSGSGSSIARILKNGTEIASNTISEISSGSFTEDINIASVAAVPGDVFSLEHRNTGDGESLASILQLFADDGYTTIGPFIARSDL